MKSQKCKSSRFAKKCEMSRPRSDIQKIPKIKEETTAELAVAVKPNQFRVCLPLLRRFDETLSVLTMN